MSHGAVGRHEEVQIASATPFVTTMPSSFSRACALSSDSRPAKRENHAESFFPLPIEHTSDQALMIEATEARLTPQRTTPQRTTPQRSDRGRRERPAVRRVCPVRDGMKMVVCRRAIEGRGPSSPQSSPSSPVMDRCVSCDRGSRTRNLQSRQTSPRPFRPNHRS